MEINILPHKKFLDKEIATSILCPLEMLQGHGKLIEVAENRDNHYYNVEGTNTVIMHVESDFCILTDYLVHVYNEEKLCSLPWMLSINHYAVYQIGSGGPSRDWIKNSNSGVSKQHIGYDIKELMYGNGVKIATQQYEHRAETFNEMDKNTGFGANLERESHRKKYEVKSQVDLDELIKKIQDNQDKPGGILM